MKKYIFISATALLILSSCGEGKKETTGNLNDKKVLLEKLTKDKNLTEEKIKELQQQIADADTSAESSANIKLVSVTPVAKQDFKHYIDLQGKVDADNISYISPRGMGGQIKAIYIKQGDFVKKGQLILKLDNAIANQQVIASKQQLEGIKTQLNFAKNIYTRQQNLWSQGIGTEVQLISAKNNVESLENQLSSAQEQVKIAEEQLKTANVYSDVSGYADVVSVRVGELFQGVTAMGPQIQIVNTSSLKVVTNVPENYATRVRKGSPVIVLITDINKQYNSSVSLISQSIDITQRGFVAEAKIPYDINLKPNQLAVVKILDYHAPNALVIPVNVIQTDEKGKYVFVLDKLSNGKSVAKKKQVVVGEVNSGNVEIKSGLTAGEQVITEGYQNLYEGQIIVTELK